MKKAEFRTIALKKRNQIVDREEKSAVIADYVLKSDWFQSAKTIFLYCSYRSEVETAGILGAALKQGKSVAVPKVKGRQMQFYQISSPDEIVSGYKGIPEPSGGGEAVIPEKDDLILVPGAAFDRQGYRMGYGCGFYDRYLTVHQEEYQKVGLAFWEQIYEEIPREEYDVRMSALVTEKGIIRK